MSNGPSTDTGSLLNSLSFYFTILYLKFQESFFSDYSLLFTFILYSEFIIYLVAPLRYHYHSYCSGFCHVVSELTYDWNKE